MIETDIAQFLPEGWSLSNLICLDEADWQANITDGEYVATGTGEDIEAALASAAAKALNGDHVGRLFHLAPLKAPATPAELGLLALLGLDKPKEPFRRRF